MFHIIMWKNCAESVNTIHNYSIAFNGLHGFYKGLFRTLSSLMSANRVF